MQAVWNALRKHPFIKSILQADQITLVRRHYLHLVMDGYASETYQDEENGKIIDGHYTIAIWDYAYIAPPNANDVYDIPVFWGTDFEPTVFHEFAHVAAYETPDILEAYTENMDSHPQQPDPVGKAYDWAGTAGSQGDPHAHRASETYAMTVACYQYNRLSLTGTWQEGWAADKFASH